MKNNEGNAEMVYLYQGDRYIGEAYDVESKRYNDCRAEWTDEDKENYLFQNKEQAKFHKLVKDIKAELPKLGVQDVWESDFISEATSDVEIIETPPAQQPEYDYEFDMEDIEAFAKSMC